MRDQELEKVERGRNAVGEWIVEDGEGNMLRIKMSPGYSKTASPKIKGKKKLLELSKTKIKKRVLKILITSLQSYITNKLNIR